MFTKIVILFAAIFIYSHCEQHTWLQPVFLDQTTSPENLPAQKGKLIEGLIWDDKTGKNVIVITKYSKGKIHEPDYIEELCATQYLKRENTYETVWRIKDFNYVDAKINYVKGTLKLFDLDEDSIAESSFFYTITSSDTQSLKFMLHTRGKKLAIRGYWGKKAGLDKQGLDSIVEDNSFKKYSKAFLQYAKNEWKEITSGKDEGSALQSWKTNCLSKNDSLQVIAFKSQIEKLLKKGDTTSILKFVHFPLNVDGVYTDELRFKNSYYKVLATYLLKNTIGSDEIESLERSEYFKEIENVPGCYSYYIWNAFPELEFNVNFTLEKRNGILKVVVIDIIG